MYVCMVGGKMANHCSIGPEYFFPPSPSAPKIPWADTGLLSIYKPKMNIEPATQYEKIVNMHVCMYICLYVCMYVCMYMKLTLGMASKSRYAVATTWSFLGNSLFMIVTASL